MEHTNISRSDTTRRLAENSRSAYSNIAQFYILVLFYLTAVLVPRYMLKSLRSASRSTK